MKEVMKKGQVWIETVLYTLIAFVMIGLVLTYAKPKIQEIQDKTIVEQSVQMLQDINSIIASIPKVPGNQRSVEVMIKKGVLEINGVNDTLIFKIESRYAYTEYGASVDVGGVNALTKKIGNTNEVILTSDYSKYNITYNNNDEIKLLNKASLPYTLLISNKGGDGNKTIININF